MSLSDEGLNVIRAYWNETIELDEGYSRASKDIMKLLAEIDRLHYSKEADTAYLEGFEKARELGDKALSEGFHRPVPIPVDIREVGEEDVKLFRWSVLLALCLLVYMSGYNQGFNRACDIAEGRASSR